MTMRQECVVGDAIATAVEAMSVESKRAERVTGDTPHKLANAASERRHSGLSPSGHEELPQRRLDRRR